ncbi:hypothetical protein [Thermobaculum terrenum]|nr:hypothetical protein [Thermobaculum terrenum]
MCRYTKFAGWLGSVYILPSESVYVTVGLFVWKLGAIMTILPAVTPCAR